MADDPRKVPFTVRRTFRTQVPIRTPGIPAVTAQAASRCGSWIVSTPETALRSAGT